MGSQSLGVAGESLRAKAIVRTERHMHDLRTGATTYLVSRTAIGASEALRIEGTVLARLRAVDEFCKAHPPPRAVAV